MAVSREVRRFLDALLKEAELFEGTLPEVGKRLRDAIARVEALSSPDVSDAAQVAREAGVGDTVIEKAFRAVDAPQREAAEETAAAAAEEQAAVAAEEQQRQEVNDGAEAIESQTQITFVRDEDGNVALDQLGRPIIEGDINGQTMVWDETLGGLAPAFLPEEPEGPPLIGGFPDDYRIEEPEEDARLRAAQELMGPGASSVSRQLEDRIGATPRYYDFDQWRNFATKSPEYQSMVQAQLIEAGLMKESDYVPGVWTFEAARAMEFAMAESNATSGRRSWVDILRDRAAGRDEAGVDEETEALLASRQLVLPAFREPDYASLSINVKDLFRNQLGRDPADWEVALLADQLNTDYRAAYDADVAALTAEFEAGNRAIIEADQTGGPAVAGAGTVAAIDPVGRLRQRFEDKYASEFELGEDRIAERQNATNVFSILTRTNNLMSGGVAS